MHHSNSHSETVASFGDEWSRFDQRALSQEELATIYDDYFSLFPWHSLSPEAEGFDMGCGSGRWASFVAPRVGKLHCIDPSEAIDVARSRLEHLPNVLFHKSTVRHNPIPIASQDFGYSLGVLHHVPDTASAIASCAALLKPGAPLLLYLYYSLDNRPFWYRMIWQATNIVRLCICRLPSRPKHVVTDLIAGLVYYPLSRLAALLESFGLPFNYIPLCYYRKLSFYTMRTDSRDRFGTPLEQRFTRSQISEMCTAAGLVNLTFSPNAPYWCVLAFKAEY